MQLTHKLNVIVTSCNGKVDKRNVSEHMIVLADDAQKNAAN